jgi:hypothetical protein
MPRRKQSPSRSWKIIVLTIYHETNLRPNARPYQNPHGVSEAYPVHTGLGIIFPISNNSKSYKKLHNQLQSYLQEYYKHIESFHELNSREVVYKWNGRKCMHCVTNTAIAKLSIIACITSNASELIQLYV